SLLRFARGFRGGRRAFFLNVQPQRAPGVGAHHRDVQACVGKVVAAAWNAAQLGGQPAADRVVVVVGQVRAEGLVEDVDLGDAHGTPAVLARLKDGLFGILVVFVFDFADDLFENVFHGDEACSTAVFVDDDGQVVAAAAEVAQQHIKAFGFRHEDCGAYQGPQVELGVVDGKQQILGEQNSHDIVAVVFVDGKARVARFDDDGQHFGQGAPDVEHIHFGARHHDVGHGLIGDFERTGKHGVGFAVEHLFVVGDIEEFLDVFAVFGLDGPHEGGKTGKQ